MLGTPNRGSGLANVPGSYIKCPDGPALEELKPESVEEFNRDFDDNDSTNYYSFWGIRGLCPLIPCLDCYGCSW